MIITEQQRRWWFATHPEFSASSSGHGSRSHGGNDEDDEGSGRPSPESVDVWTNERLSYETDNVRRSLVELAKFYFGTEFQSKTPAEKEAILREEDDDIWDHDEPSNAEGNDWWSQQPKEPDATIGPPESPSLTDRARYVLDVVCPGLTKAYDRWRTGYYDAYPWAPGPLHDALGDLGSLVAFGLMRIQTALAKAVNSAEIAALQNARQELLKIWDYANFPRGWALDDHLGWNLPRTFKGIDWFENGVARSNKSMHLGLKSYQDPAKILSVGRTYVDKLADFGRASMGDIDIRSEHITRRILRLGVPPEASEAQKSALKSLIEYGKQKGVKVEVINVP